MTQTIDPDYDQLLRLIYGGTLESRPWQSFLPRLRALLDAQVVSLVLRPPAAGDRGVILNCRRSDGESEESALADPNEWEALNYQEQFFAMDPFVNLPPEKVVIQRELIPDEALIASEYYIQYLQPIGVFHIMGVDTVEPDGLTARLRVARRQEEDAFTEADKSLCERLVPHLKQAIQIHARLLHAESERNVYAGAVDQLDVATVILDQQERVISSNAVASDILARNDGISVTGKKLQFANRAVNEQFREILSHSIAAQLAGEAGMARALRVPCNSGQADLGLVVRPVPAMEWSEGQSSPCIAVFISDPKGSEGASQALLGELFGLTPAESNLAIKLARGLSLAEVSAEQNISQHTARAQLKSVFAKTGVARQAELVRLVLKSVANLG